MDRELEAACQAAGWAELYERRIDGLGSEQRNGERPARSPFPMSTDNGPSFNVNMRNGFWRDWHLQGKYGDAFKGGNIVQFDALMSASDDGGQIAGLDYGAAERALKVELGLAIELPTGWPEARTAAMQADWARVSQAWHRRKPWWFAPVMAELGIGWDEQAGRIVLPVYDMAGKFVNAKMYRPGAQPKSYWAAGGLGANLLFPHKAINESWVVLTEGEPDAISLRMLGFNGCSGTMGAGNPVPAGGWHRGKTVYVLMDIDKPGRSAVLASIGAMSELAAGIVKCTLPEWPDMPDKADVSDWIMHMYLAGQSLADMQRHVSECLASGQQLVTQASILDAEPTIVTYANSLSARHAGMKIQFDAHIDATTGVKYKMPTQIQANCQATGHTWCSRCAMRTIHRGNGLINLDPRSQHALEYVNTDIESQARSICRNNGIYDRCPDLRMSVVSGIDLSPVILGPTLDEAAATSAGSLDRVRHEAFVIQRNGNIHDNTSYRLTGFCYPMPRTQKQVLLLDTAERLLSNIDEFSIPAERLDALKKFQPNQDGEYRSLYSVAEDTCNAYTLVKGRADLHMALRTMWHSICAFPFAGSTHERGWIEMLVVGDTRCGKSKTFKEMAKLYGTGQLVDSKHQTPAGILAAVENSSITGERYVVPGLYPRHDRRGPVCFDEFTSHFWEKSTVLDAMSSTRAEGKVVIVKAASATFWARVRSCWFANPGSGRLMSSMGMHGCEVITRLIQQPEDVARFDFAMAVTQEDVPPEIMNSIDKPTEPIHDQEAHRDLLMWAWSRKPHQIVWEAGAEQRVVEMALQMCKVYDPGIPLVEPADQRMRLAKVAVSIAAQLFSSPDGEQLLVKVSHVNTAVSLMVLFYNKPTFGYDRYSAMMQVERTIADPDDVAVVLNDIFGDQRSMMAERMARMYEFTLQIFTDSFRFQAINAQKYFQRLSANRCFRPARGARSGLYEITPQFAKFLAKYAEDNRNMGKEDAKTER